MGEAPARSMTLSVWFPLVNVTSPDVMLIVESVRGGVSRCYARGREADAFERCFTWLFYSKLSCLFASEGVPISLNQLAAFNCPAHGQPENAK